MKKILLRFLSCVLGAALFIAPLLPAAAEPADGPDGGAGAESAEQADVYPAPETAPATNEIPAEEIEISFPDGLTTHVLTDANRGTGLPFVEGDEIYIKSATPFSHMYFVWDTPPGAYEISLSGDVVLDGGKNGFLHEYYAVESPTTQATLRLHTGEYKMCDIYLFSEGDVPDWVQIWQPPLEKADLLALPTHADDEHLFFGGTLPYYAGEKGLAVQVVYMTNHFGEPYRPHELLNGLWTVGVRAYPVMGPFPDLYASLASLSSAEECFGRENVLAFQVEMLRRFQPQVVVAHDLNGEYGHGAHILNAETLLEALPLAADETAYPESAATYGTWDVPKTYLHLYGENQLTMDWNQPLSAFGGRTALDMAKEGFNCHTSQLEYFSVEDYGDYDCRLFGLARSTVGEDVAKNDFFENIDLAALHAPEAADETSPVTAPAAPVNAASKNNNSNTVSTPASTPEQSGVSPWVFVVVGAFVTVFALVWIILLLRPKKRRPVPGGAARPTSAAVQSRRPTAQLPNSANTHQRAPSGRRVYRRPK